MLVISRKIDESLRIGDKVQIMVLGVERGKVKLGITAPADVPIYREELYQSIVQGNQSSLFTSQEMVNVLKKALASSEASKE